MCNIIVICVDCTYIYISDIQQEDEGRGFLKTEHLGGFYLVKGQYFQVLKLELPTKIESMKQKQNNDKKKKQNISNGFRTKRHKIYMILEFIQLKIEM